MARRSRTRRGAESALAALYDGLPTIQCQGKCHTHCGPIAVTPFEDRRMAEASGGSLPIMMPAVDVDTGLNCALLVNKRCSIYESRPLICRLFGLVDDPLMRCPYGCVPVPRYLTNEETSRLLRKAEEISRRFQEETTDA
jgi:Fe-S-cluster containining protein